MGLLSRIRRGIDSVRGQRERLIHAGSLGAVDVPGQATLELPAGTVFVTFELTAPNSRDVDFFWIRPEIELVVSGGATFTETKGHASLNDHDIGTYRGSWGRFEVPAAGAYEISARAHHGRYAGLNPRVLFDAG